MKILFIDPICLPGHINFNRIHISALQKEFGIKNVDICVIEDYEKKMNISNSTTVYTVPKNIINTSSGLKYRLSMYKVFREIMKILNLRDYDNIILSCFDEVALCMSRFPKSYVIIHNNIACLNNRIKKICFRQVLREHIPIVLNNSSKEFIKSKYNREVQLVNHGLVNPFSIKFREYPFPINEDEFIILTPSYISADRIEILNIISSPSIQSWLEKNNAYLCIRGEKLNNISNRVRFIEGRLSEVEYQSIILRADCLLICYPTTFKYRESGILNEAFANDKISVIKDNGVFEHYKSLIKDELFYSSEKSLIKALDYIKSDGVFYKNPISLEKIKIPDYSFFYN